MTASPNPAPRFTTNPPLTQPGLDMGSVWREIYRATRRMALKEELKYRQGKGVSAFFSNSPPKRLDPSRFRTTQQNHRARDSHIVAERKRQDLGQALQAVKHLCRDYGVTLAEVAEHAGITDTDCW